MITNITREVWTITGWLNVRWNNFCKTVLSRESSFFTIICWFRMSDSTYRWLSDVLLYNHIPLMFLCPVRAMLVVCGIRLFLWLINNKLQCKYASVLISESKWASASNGLKWRWTKFDAVIVQKEMLLKQTIAKAQISENKVGLFQQEQLHKQ